MIAATFGAGQVAYSVLWFALVFIEIWLMISIFIDIFRSHDMKGWAKALWLFLVILFPLIGIILYLIFRGDKMRVHQAQAAADLETAWRRYPPHMSDGHGSKTDQLTRLAELRDRGDISADEFQRLKAEIFGPRSAWARRSPGSRRRPRDRSRDWGLTRLQERRRPFLTFPKPVLRQ